MITKKKKRISCLLRTAVSVMAFLETGVVSASSAVWNGTESAFWTNSANWSAAPYPSGDESANFNTAGNGYATVALDGLSSIRYVAFDTAAAAAYMIGSGGANVQKLTVAAEGQISVSSSTGADQAFAAELRLPGNYTFSNSHPTHTLTFNNVTCTGNSSLSLNGSGALSILGNLSRGSSVFNVYQNGTGPVMLSGTDNQINAWTFNGVNAVLNLAAGSLTSFNGGGGNNLMATQNTVINGPGAMKLSTGGGENFADNSVASGKTLTINAKLTGATGFEYWNGSMFGTVALLGQNDFTVNVIMNAAGTIAVTNIGNQASTTSNLGAGTKVIFNSSSGGASRLMYTGPGEETDRILEFRKNGIVDQSGQSGLLKYTSDVSSSGGLTMTLQGSTLGTGEIAGVIPSSTAVAKSGSGTWFLSASNTYSGATSVDAGTLIVCGTNGAVKSTSGLTLNGGTFALLNTATSNLEDRLSDALPVTLNGGTFCFSNDLAVAAFSETAGVLTVNSGAGTVTAVQAAVGGTSALRFAAIIRVGNGTVNFTGEGLGDSDRNRIFIAGQADGLIGSWATWNGTRYAAYSGSRGVYAASEAVDIAARGYSVITNDASLAVRISLPGESGPIALETSPVSSVGTLIQNSDTPAVVTMTNTLFRLSDLRVVSGKASLTIGTAPREGTLSVLSEGGCLSVENDSVNGTLTVNASVMSNSAACSLVKNGVGTVVLAGENLYGGATQVNNGELVFGSGRHAIGQLTVATASFILTNAAPAYVSVTNNSAYIGNGSRDFGHMTLGGNASWAGYLYPFNVGQATLVIGHYGRGILTLQDNASVTQRLYVGNAGGSAGAVYQNGGVMHNWGGSSSDSRIGMTGYGYYELNSGTFTNMGYTQLGRDYTGIGIVKQFGGAFKMGAVYNGTLAISRGGTGVVYMADGTFNTSASLSVGEASDNGLIRGYAEFTMAGGVAEINGNVNMADRTNMFAVVNLNGGVLAANAITRGMRTGSLALVRFDGGTLKARTSGNLFGSGTAAPDAVNIYDGGAVFDIPDAVCTIPVPLLAPAGNGVTSIGVTSRAGYIGPPMVTISGGGGSGATAVARFDSASGTVTGIEVTSPGFGYTSTPTVSLSGGGTNVQTSLGSVSLGANMSGGITKLGSGTLTLSATNTYAGATIISNGTLRLGCVQALPANGVVQFEGGVLELNGFSATNGGGDRDGQRHDHGRHANLRQRDADRRRAVAGSRDRLGCACPDRRRNLPDTAGATGALRGSSGRIFQHDGINDYEHPDLVHDPHGEYERKTAMVRQHHLSLHGLSLEQHRNQCHVDFRRKCR